MPNQEKRLCICTQTAYKLPDYYKHIFKSYDVFFITFKKFNQDAVDYMPNSTWSDGRNRLWAHVKDRYDYYLFLDDDLMFHSISPLRRKLARIPLIGTVNLYNKLFTSISPEHLRKKLRHVINSIQPDVCSFHELTSSRAEELNYLAIQSGAEYRALGWFDAMATLFSNRAGKLLLPYDTSISGWWSAQIPIYMLSHFAFRDSAICLMDIGVKNNSHEVYRDDYDGKSDLLKMVEWLQPGIKNKGSYSLFTDQKINHYFGREFIVGSKQDSLCLRKDKTINDILQELSINFDMSHPYLDLAQKIDGMN